MSKHRPLGKLTDQEAYVLAEREKGRTFKSIANDLGQCSANAHIMHQKAQKRADAKSKCPAHDAVSYLSGREQRALLGRRRTAYRRPHPEDTPIDIFDEDAHIKASKITKEELHQIPNLGRAGIAKIEEWLAANGLTLASK